MLFEYLTYFGHGVYHTTGGMTVGGKNGQKANAYVCLYENIDRLGYIAP
jgi:hypothetical protein